MNNRNSKIELLRIISMVLIVLSHYTVHNGIDNSSLPLGVNRFLLEATSLGGLGVVIFILITGYFCIDSKKPFKLKKIFLLWFQTVFYSLGIYLIFLILNIQDFSFVSFIKNLFPIVFFQYWFINAYFLLYLFTPFLNKFLNNLTKKEHLIFNIIVFVMFSIIPTVLTKDYYGNAFIQFILFYSIGAYIKKYAIINEKEKKKNLIYFILLSLSIIASIFVFDLIGQYYNIFAKHSNYLLMRSSFINILLAITIFKISINGKDFNNKYVNKIASTMLGVYLISDNNLIRKIIWTDIFKVYKFVETNYLIFHMFCTVLIIIVLCIIIDLIRSKVFEKIIIKLYDKLSDKLKKSKVYNKVITYFTKIIIND